jgi:hypothetical protein
VPILPTSLKDICFEYKITQYQVVNQSDNPMINGDLTFGL